MRTVFVLAILSGIGLSVGCKQDAVNKLKFEPPTGDNKLEYFGLTTVRYTDIVKEANLVQPPWPDYYWATRYGGLNLRWQIDNDSEWYQDYIYKFPDAAELKKMTSAELSALSPAEKYDIWVGRTNLGQRGTLTALEHQKVLDAAERAEGDNIPDWVGLCNGQSLAASFEKQPMKPATVHTPWGVPMTFGASDIKGLLSTAYLDYQDNIFVKRIGSICYDADGDVERDADGRPTDRDCRDLLAASLHVTLSEMIAKRKVGFVVESDKREEVWNYPVYGYRMRYDVPVPVPANYKHAAPGTTQILRVETELKYIEGGGPASHGFSNAQIKADSVTTMVLKYTLELDAHGVIIGSEYERGSDHPDFIWTTTEKPNPTNLGADYPISMDKLRELVQKSL